MEFDDILLKLYNTLTKRLENFQPMEKGKVRLITCGPSIYQLPHIGNYRTFIFEDILQRYLEYLGYRVERVITINDVEDKSLAEAEKQRSGDCHRKMGGAVCYLFVVAWAWISRRINGKGMGILNEAAFPPL